MNIFNGKTPIQRQNPRSGESQYYYINPGQGNFTAFSEVKTTDIPDNQPLFNIGQGLNQVQTNDPNCHMTFNGQNLNLYNNNELVNSLNAQSGRDEYQSAQYQNVPNKGPIPEGTYYANQNQRQSLTLKNLALKTAEKLGINTNPKSSWSGNPISWGTSRVWLQPDANTNTYGRDGFSIHGGWSKGSAGCIDIPWQTGKLSNFLDDCQDSVPLNVKYPENW